MTRIIAICRLTTLCVAALLGFGCSGWSAVCAADQPPDDKTILLRPEKLSAHGFLSVADLTQFQKGRSKKEILESLQWRVYALDSSLFEGKAVEILTYRLLVNPPDLYKSATFFAVFVDGKFEKFTPWMGAELEYVPYHGTTRTRPKPTRIDDYGWHMKVLATPAVTTEELREEAQSKRVIKKEVDWGLTVAMLLARIGSPDGLSNPKPDYARNAALRDQFNAARLELKMSEDEVERVLKAKPLESGEIEGVTCKFYGSFESFSIKDAFHFSNVLVLFRDGKAISISSGDPRGEEKQKGVIAVLRERDREARSSSKDTRSRK
jgi:hypothetical protein